MAIGDRFHCRHPEAPRPQPAMKKNDGPTPADRLVVHQAVVDNDDAHAATAHPPGKSRASPAQFFSHFLLLFPPPPRPTDPKKKPPPPPPPAPLVSPGGVVKKKAPHAPTEPRRGK